MTSTSGLTVMADGRRYFRAVTAVVLQRFYELDLGVRDHTFDHNLLNYHLDVERLLGRIASVQERLVLEHVHKNGLTQVEALRAARVPCDTPDAAAQYLRTLEARIGRIFARHGIANIDRYLA